MGEKESEERGTMEGGIEKKLGNKPPRKG